jgi:(p)ppGpp synthase/HD superfamily hydrolase
MATLEQAIQLAVEAHRGQTDRYGSPYILHPLRVMQRVRSDTARITAVLHDVVEDTPYTFSDLRERGFSSTVVAAVDRLTRRDDEPYEAFIERIKPDALAVEVKIADLEDNMDIRRATRPLSEDDVQRMERYRRAWAVLIQGPDLASGERFG